MGKKHKGKRGGRGGGGGGGNLQGQHKPPAQPEPTESSTEKEDVDDVGKGVKEEPTKESSGEPKLISPELVQVVDPPKCSTEKEAVDDGGKGVKEEPTKESKGESKLISPELVQEADSKLQKLQVTPSVHVETKEDKGDQTETEIKKESPTERLNVDLALNVKIGSPQPEHTSECQDKVLPKDEHTVPNNATGTNKKKKKNRGGNNKNQQLIESGPVEAPGELKQVPIKPDITVASSVKQELPKTGSAKDSLNKTENKDNALKEETGSQKSEVTPNAPQPPNIKVTPNVVECNKIVATTQVQPTILEVKVKDPVESPKVVQKVVNEAEQKSVPYACGDAKVTECASPKGEPPSQAFVKAGDPQPEIMTKKQNQPTKNSKKCKGKSLKEHQPETEEENYSDKTDEPEIIPLFGDIEIQIEPKIDLKVEGSDRVTNKKPDKTAPEMFLKYKAVKTVKQNQTTSAKEPKQEPQNQMNEVNYNQEEKTEINTENAIVSDEPFIGPLLEEDIIKLERNLKQATLDPLIPQSPSKEETKLEALKVIDKPQKPVAEKLPKHKGPPKDNQKNKNKKESHRPCPYEHPTAQHNPPKITGMLFETINKEDKIEENQIENETSTKENIIKTKTLAFAEALKENEALPLQYYPEKDKEIKCKVDVPVKMDSVIPNDCPMEVILENVPLDKQTSIDTPPLITTNDNLLLQSMNDSTISDLTVVVEQSLDNIANVPDEEIMKLFDIVSKDFERTPEPREKSKVNVFKAPMEQAGAALATLIEAVEQTESRIKESVEETKNKQRQNKSKKSKSKTPEKKASPKKDKNTTNLLGDAVIVDSSGDTVEEAASSSSTPTKKQSPDPKNVERSDFVQSVEGQQQDGAKSLLKPKMTTEIETCPIKKSPTPPAKIDCPQGEIERKPDSKNVKPAVPPRPESTKKSPLAINKKQLQKIESPRRIQEIEEDDDDDEDEEYIEYKFSSRKVFLSNACHTCQSDLRAKSYPCPNCSMIYYCSEKHFKEDEPSHKDFCLAIQEVAKVRGGHVYNNAKELTPSEFRNLRVHTLNTLTNNLKRPLLPVEKEMMLFPKVCVKVDCKNWKQAELVNCGKCHQVAYCKEHPEHLPKSHASWCLTYSLYQKLILSKRIEPPMASLILSTPFVLPSTVEDVFKTLYRGPVRDLCSKVVLTQLSTGPLTALNALQLCKMPIQPTTVIHLIGAELQFEGDTLDKWEAFFLHLMPGVTELRLVFVGPELNVENLPVEILSRIRMCRNCRLACRNVKFDFQCRTLYHDYAKSNSFTKPDLICYFNPGLYRMTGFSGMDTWPETITTSLQLNCPIVVTSYTEVESPMDFAQIKKFASARTQPLQVIHPPSRNPFASQRPERNFISDDVAPMIFKNYYYFVVK